MRAAPRAASAWPSDRRPPRLVDQISSVQPKRPVASGLSGQSGLSGRPGRSGGSARPGSSATASGLHFSISGRRAAGPDSPRLMMGIPKKLVPSSPVRNLIRRIIRVTHHDCARRHPGRTAELSLLVRLLRLPQDPSSSATDPTGRPTRAFARRPTDRALKRLVRAEIEPLLERVLAPAGRARA